MITQTNTWLVIVLLVVFFFENNYYFRIVFWKCCKSDGEAKYRTGYVVFETIARDAKFSQVSLSVFIYLSD